MKSINFKLSIVFLCIISGILLNLQSSFAHNVSYAESTPSFDSENVIDGPINRFAQDFTYKFYINANHSKLGNEGTANKVTVKFWSNKKGLHSSTKIPNFKSKDALWSYTPKANAPILTHITVHIGGKDALFIDKAYLLVEKLIETWGEDNGKGWCLSTDPKDGTKDWKSYHAGCKSFTKFTISPEFRKKVLKKKQKNIKKQNKPGIGKNLSNQITLIGEPSKPLTAGELINMKNNEIKGYNKKVIQIFRSFTHSKAMENMINSIKMSEVTLVQTSDLGANECALIYPRSSSGMNAEIGIFACNMKYGKNVTLTTALVHGGCDFSERPGEGECEVGVFSNNLTVELGNGATTEFELNGPSASACKSISADKTCYNAGATLAETSVSIQDKNGNGVGASLSVGVGGGLNGGYNNGVISTDIDLKLGIGASISISVDAKGAANSTYNAGKAGYTFSKGVVLSAAPEVKSFYKGEIHPFVSTTGKMFVSGINGFGKVVAGGGKQFIGGIEGAANSAGNALEDAYNSIKPW